MHLDELRKTVTASPPEDWNLIAAYNRAFAAPVTQPLIESVSEGKYGVVERFRVRAHTALLVLAADVDVSIAWGMEVDTEDTDDDTDVEDAGSKHRYTPPWRIGYLWAVRRVFVDIRYRGQLVDRWIVAHVNGGHIGVLPDGSTDFITDSVPDSPEVVTVSDFHYRLARLLHRISHGDDVRMFESLFEYTGMIKEGPDV